MEANAGVRQLLLAVLVLYVYNVCFASEHTEQTSMKFFFDPDGSWLVAASHSNCYLVRVSQTEHDHVHTNAGMEDLELKMIHDWIGKLNETQIYHTDQGLTKNVRHWCGNQDIFLLNRVIIDEPTPTSPLHSGG